MQYVSECFTVILEQDYIKEDNVDFAERVNDQIKSLIAEEKNYVGKQGGFHDVSCQFLTKRDSKEVLVACITFKRYSG